MEEYSVVCLSLSDTQRAITLLTPLRALFISSKKPLPPSHVAVKNKTFSCVIVSQKPPNIVLYCHQDKSTMGRQHLSVLLSPIPARLNIQRRFEQPLKRDRIYSLYQIETFRLKYCQDINFGMCAKPGIRIRCCIRGKYSGSIPRECQAAKNLEFSGIAVCLAGLSHLLALSLCV